MRMQGIKRKLYLFTYDKPGIQKKALQVKHSLDEVKKALEAKKK